MRLGHEPTPGEQAGAQEIYRMLSAAGYPVCPDAAVPSDLTPELAALAFWRSVKLPVPEPSIKFNEILVGLKAYLETGIEDTMTFGPVDTPFGPLTIDATADIYVDWGDPHDEVDGEEGPYRNAVGETATPGPYPDGEITHIYQYVGEYDITVRYEWTANWRIGGVSGVLTGGETSGTLEDFVAYERQAVGRP